VDSGAGVVEMSGIDFADGLRIVDLAITMLGLGAVAMYVFRYTQRHRAALLRRRSLAVTWISSLSFVGLLVAGAIVDIQRFGLVLTAVTPIHLVSVILALFATYLVARSDYAEL
jgi:hypothetical protein